jgi:hypothetical protein
MPHHQRHTQTKRLEKDLPGMQKLSASRSSYSHIRQSRFYTKIRRNKEGHYISTNGTIQPENITILNIYALNSGAPTIIKQNTSEFKGIDRTRYNNLGRSQHPLFPIDRTCRQKINKGILELNNTLDQMYLADTLQQQITHSSQQSIECFPKQNTFKIKKQI